MSEWRASASRKLQSLLAKYEYCNHTSLRPLRYFCNSSRFFEPVGRKLTTLRFTRKYNKKRTQGVKVKNGLDRIQIVIRAEGEGDRHAV